VRWLCGGVAALQTLRPKPRGQRKVFLEKWISASAGMTKLFVMLNSFQHLDFLKMDPESSSG